MAAGQRHAARSLATLAQFGGAASGRRRRPMGTWTGKCQRPCANMDSARSLVEFRRATGLRLPLPYPQGDQLCAAILFTPGTQRPRAPGFAIPPGSRRNVRTKLTKRTKSPRCGWCILSCQNCSIERAHWAPPAYSVFAITVARPGWRGVAFASVCAEWKPCDIHVCSCRCFARLPLRHFFYYCGLFRAAMCGSRCWLSPLFCEDAQIFIFPPP